MADKSSCCGAEVYKGVCQDCCEPCDSIAEDEEDICNGE